MKNCRFKQALVFTLSLLLTSLIAMTGCAGNTENGFIVPTFTEPGPPPTEVTVEQLVSDYMTDEAAADAKYKGERLLLTNVEVEDIKSYFLDARATDIYIMNSSVKFIPRYLNDIDYILVGFVVDIVGVCHGLIWGRIFIRDCWVGVIEGDVGDMLPDPY